jgi:hypothetical protein
LAKARVLPGRMRRLPNTLVLTQGEPCYKLYRLDRVGAALNREAANRAAPQLSRMASPSSLIHHRVRPERLALPRPSLGLMRTLLAVVRSL